MSAIGTEYDGMASTITVDNNNFCDGLLESIWFTPLYIGTFVSAFVIGSVFVTQFLNYQSTIFRSLPQHKQRDTVIYLLNSGYYFSALIPFIMTATHVLVNDSVTDWDMKMVEVGGRVVCLGMFVYFLDMIYRGQPPRWTLILHHVVCFAIFSSAVDPTFCRDVSTDEELRSFTFRIRLMFLRCVIIATEFPIFVLLAIHKLHTNPTYVSWMAKICVWTYPLFQLSGHIGHIVLLIDYWNDLEIGWKIWYTLVLFVIVVANWFTQQLLFHFAKKFSNPKTRRDPDTHAWIFQEDDDDKATKEEPGKDINNTENVAIDV